ncbi:MAG: glycosyltransferase family 4 protein [Anaerolineae bacterium]|nr:glycosyltransferase family 4 protein [Anaerolineae bacterium]
MAQQTNSHLRNLAFIGNYLPRLCGIATFTTDLCEAVASAYQETTCFTIAVNDTAAGYAYPPRVRFALDEKDVASYRRAAEFLNFNDVDVVCLQHEYGIFGGVAGSHILALLRELRMPVITTLHTVLREPDPNQREVVRELAELSTYLIVMSQVGTEILQEVFQVPEEKIRLIPHGIPDVSFVDPNFYKEQFGVESKHVLLTFGLLSPNKGIENVIEALPAIVDNNHDVMYIVLGATHPHVKRKHGETYRLSLERLARERGVEGNVIFHDRFVTLEELIEFIGVADIYVTPYLDPAQITSGTLAYTVGAGKAVISTPYWYAEELLDEKRGLLVPFKDPFAIAQKVIWLLEHDKERHATRKRAYMYGREMIWPQVARRYMETFEQAFEEQRQQPEHFVARTLEQRPVGFLPEICLDHLRRMTDDTGILQHAIFNVPNYTEGYTTDDNARALIVPVILEGFGEHEHGDIRLLASRYMAYLWHAFDAKTGRFHNFLTYDRRWLKDQDTEDGHARALWALGVVLARSRDEGLLNLAGQLFERALPAVLEFTSPRAWAFTLIGLQGYMKRFLGARDAHHTGEVLAERLMDLYRVCSAPDWLWFEDSLTYDNAKLPHALLMTGPWLERNDMVETGLKSLEWLISIQRAEQGYFVPIGSNGFYPRGGERARFDQQPIEAHSTISACAKAYRETGEERWVRYARWAFDWFLGYNDLGLPVGDPTTGGCRDGLHSSRINQNQGAESTLAFLLSLLELRLAEHVIDGDA